MKLATLKEAKLSGQQDLSYVNRLFNDLKQFKSDITYDNFAWFVAHLQTELEYDRKDLQYMFYEGVTGTKGNPKAMNDTLDTFFGYDEEDADQAYATVLDSAKRFFQIKP